MSVIGLIQHAALRLTDASGESGRILLSLFIMLASAKLMAELFERLRQPAVVGEILAGIIIGPSVLSLVQPSSATEVLGEVGVVFLLFTVGLETRPGDIRKVGRIATAVAVLGVVVPFFAGWGLLVLWPGYSAIEAVFLGAGMVATSVGITARVLSSMGLIGAAASRVILTAAVIDDIIGLLVLAVVSSLAEGRIRYLHIALTALIAIGFAILILTVGGRAVRRVKPRVSSLRIDHSFLLFALVLCFGLAAVAGLIGIAGIVGAFLAGVALSEATDDTRLHLQAGALTEFAAPFFLVSIGMKLNLSIFLSPAVVALAAVVTVLAIATKLIGCGIGALTMGRRRALQVGLGMTPRGEVGIVVAQIGLALSAVGDKIYGVVLAMAVLTTLAAPPFIKIAFAPEKRLPRDDDEVLDQPLG